MYLNRNQFSLLIVDVESQTIKLTTLIPFMHNFSKVVLIGDFKQFPFIVTQSLIPNRWNIFTNNNTV
ncbi:hypothetical protein PIROE2DRAFT_9386 [Piromyces sp. E2]|nr:hypothetical protein PIROE2DRAFT_9386 [Piromyces sp. E2]|eukprot:OUM63998.1 hypothetical protein PIROE2DRAFT_9386 [Piromyces sp. E2]